MDRVGKALGELLANKRRSSDLSQEELAFRASIHRTYLSQIERGVKSPTIKTLLKICEALDVRLSDIVRELEQQVRLGKTPSEHD